MNVKYDFSGWVTKNNVTCSDGRIIQKDAFAHCDGQIVPLVWNHKHDAPDNIVGNVLLENRPEGVYGYGAFNNTEMGKDAKECVFHGDITSLSIYANHLKQNGSAVLHGMIREVSLVLAGANPEAKIDSVIIHGEDTKNYNFGYSLDDDEVVICMGDEVELFHEDTTEPEDKESISVSDVKKVFNTLTEQQKAAVYVIVDSLLEEERKKDSKASTEAEHSDTEPAENNDNKDDDADELQHDDADELQHTDTTNPEEDDANMKKNVFDNDSENSKEQILAHADESAIFNDISVYGSLRRSALEHGIDNIELLFPDAKATTTTPEFIRRDNTWVGYVMSRVHATPFSRIKSMFADITGPDARARGYIKGNFKEEEVFELLKRETTPTTVYKKQKFDRDDLVDITGFDKVSWIRGEMRIMLDEELARAYLVGDGRSASSPDKINPNNIRPIWSDSELFTIHRKISVSASLTPDQRAKQFIRETRKSLKDYRGSGNLTMFVNDDILTDCLLMEDNVGRIIYDTEDKLATALRVKKIIATPILENLVRVDSEGNTLETLGIMVDLSDYNVGTDRGGEVTNFDQFDIDYNRQVYLSEVRCSGALTKPFSAVVIEASRSLFHTVDPEDPTTTVLGKQASELQNSVYVNDGYIQGTLKYVTGYTGYSEDTSLQSGHFLALKFEQTEGATTQVSLVGGNQAPQTLDSNMNAVFRISNKNTQKVKVTTTKDGITVEDIYNLSSLKLLSE